MGLTKKIGVLGIMVTKKVVLFILCAFAFLYIVSYGLTHQCEGTTINAGCFVGVKKL